MKRIHPEEAETRVCIDEQDCSPKGKEKLPSEEEILFLFKVMNGGLLTMVL